jgi:hypothetical protein
LYEEVCVPIDLEHLPGLVLFARVAQHGSLSGAAQSLGLSRSAVSKQLSAPVCCNAPPASNP